MAGYFNLTLDTTAPSGVTVKINGDEEKTNSSAVMLTITCSDADTSGYQMKIWGTSDAQSEDSAEWETFANEKSATLPAGDGIKTVYVKVRDDVWNESAAVSDTIKIYTNVPVVTINGPDIAKISKVSGKDVSVITFNAGMSDISAFKVMVVENINAAHDAATNKRIPVAGGSKYSKDSGFFTDDETYLEASDGYMIMQDNITVTLYGTDLESASPGDGVKIVKVFVRDYNSELWSL